MKAQKTIQLDDTVFVPWSDKVDNCKGCAFNGNPKEDKYIHLCEIAACTESEREDGTPRIWIKS